MEASNDACNGNKNVETATGDGAAPASTISLQVVQNGSFGFCRSVYLLTDHVSYIFNCPESNRRLLTEHGCRRPFTMKHIFITHGSWSNIAGLAGLAAYFKSVGVKELHLHGPLGLVDVVNVARSFEDRSKNEKKAEDLIPKLIENGVNFYDDSNISVHCAPIFDSPKIEKEFRVDSSIRTDEMAVVFICKLKPKWGKVLIEKCVESGVKIGPDVGRLQRGQCVRTENGRLVYPNEVREAPLSPEYFLVVECPNENFVTALFECDALRQFYTNSDSKSEDTGILRIIVHFTPKEIAETDEYRKWMTKFPDVTVHWICNESAPNVCHYEGIFRLQTQLNYVHDGLFPLLWHHTLLENSITDEKFENKVVRAEPFYKYCFRPKNGFQPAGDQPDAVFSMDEIKSCPGLEAALEKFKNESKAIDLANHGNTLHHNTYPIITFFGTAAASPTKHRNVSAIQVDLNEFSSFLFDCGESTVSQMQLFYGPDELVHRLTRLKMVAISHLHLDHHFGLYSLIIERKRAFEKLHLPYEKLQLLAAAPLARAHANFSRHVEDASGLCDFYATASDKLEENLRRLEAKIGLKNIQIVKVIHPQCATGFVVTTMEGKRLVYSGDTRPCEALVEAGRDADLLIHEASLNDGWEADAVTKKHCTKSEAVQVARDMNARWTILTHFTGQNSKLPFINDSLLNDDRIGIAFDFMRVQWRQLPLLAKLMPVLNVMFGDYVETQRARFRRKMDLGDAEEKDEVACKNMKP